MPNYALGPTTPICYPTGITPTINAADFRLYPNPAQSTVTVEYPQAGELRLYDVTGRLMETYNLQGGGKTASVNVGYIPVCMYQYIYTIDGIQQQAGKLVIER